MFPIHTALNQEFCKQRDCPSSEMLLIYSHQEGRSLRVQSIDSHLTKCEYCNAELQLLMRRPPENLAPLVTPKLPLALRLFAQQFLPGKKLPKKVQKRRVA